MKDKIRIITMCAVDGFMIFTLLFSILIRPNVSAIVFCGFACTFTSYMLMTTLIPNRENEYISYKRIYANHLEGVYTDNNRLFNRLLKIISCINNSNPKLGTMYAPKLINNAHTDREKAVVNYFCGVCCENGQDFNKARTHFTNALHFDSAYTQALYHLAGVHKNLGNSKKYKENLRHAIEAQKNPAVLVDVIDSARLSVPFIHDATEFIRERGLKNITFSERYLLAIDSHISDAKDYESWVKTLLDDGVEEKMLRRSLDSYRTLASRKVQADNK